MNKEQTILIKKGTALFLLVLFAFIHGVKVIHTHDVKQSVLKETAKNASSVSSPGCFICEFHLAKDSDHDYEVTVVIAAVKSVPSYFSYNTPVVTSIGSTSSGRGPPSFS